MSTKLTEGLQHGAPGSSHHTKLPQSFFQNDSSLYEGAERLAIRRGFWGYFTGCRGRQPLRYRHWCICDFIGRAQRHRPYNSSPLKGGDSPQCGEMSRSDRGVSFRDDERHRPLQNITKYAKTVHLLVDG